MVRCIDQDLKKKLNYACQEIFTIEDRHDCDSSFENQTMHDVQKFISLVTGLQICETEHLGTIDTELMNPSSSGSMQENYDGPNLKERKLSLSNGKAPIKLFTSE